VTLRFENVDPLGEIALTLLAEAAAEIRPLYSPRIPAPPFAANSALPPRGVYLVAFVGDVPVASGALLPVDDTTAEVKRMFVRAAHRRRGIARQVLARLISDAQRLGFSTLVLETGNQQPAAMQLYEQEGFRRVPCSGRHAEDPTSVCYERHLGERPASFGL
jgi:GNAT superfamily N-acetyltransferase